MARLLRQGMKAAEAKGVLQRVFQDVEENAEVPAVPSLGENAVESRNDEHQEDHPDEEEGTEHRLEARRDQLDSGCEEPCTVTNSW